MPTPNAAAPSVRTDFIVCAWSMTCLQFPAAVEPFPRSPVLGKTCQGSLLREPVPTRAETWKNFAPLLEEIYRDIIAARLASGVAWRHAAPAFICTDTYHKHRLLLERQHTNILQDEIRARGLRGEPAVPPVIVTGDPFHCILSGRRLISPRCNDASSFARDHSDLLLRLSAEPFDKTVLEEAKTAPLITLTQDALELLRLAVRRPIQEFRHGLAANPSAKGEIEAFLASPSVRRCAATWKQAFGTVPPRPVIARLCRAAAVDLPAICEFRNFLGRRDFKQEILRTRRWYKRPRCDSRPRKFAQELRVGEHVNPRVQGRRCVWSQKLEKHYASLSHQLKLDGLMKWRRVALSMREGNVRQQTGTVSVERVWSWYNCVFPAAQRTILHDTFALLNDMAYLKHVYTHHHSSKLGASEPWARADPGLLQKATEMAELLRAEQAGVKPAICLELEEALRRHAESQAAHVCEDRA